MTTTDDTYDFVCEIDCVSINFIDQEQFDEMVHNLNLLKERHQLDVCDIRVQRK